VILKTLTTVALLLVQSIASAQDSPDDGLITVDAIDDTRSGDYEDETEDRDWFGPHGAMGVGAEASWLFHPQPPGQEHGFAGHILIVVDIRPDPYFPWSFRLEIGFGGRSDAGTGTLSAPLTRAFPIGLDLGRFVVWRLGFRFTGVYHARGYSSAASSDRYDPSAGIDTELAIKLSSVGPMLDPFRDNRIELGLSAALEFLDDDSLAVHLGARMTFLMW
jgi:hypothetical protein